MDKAPDAFRTISEVADELDVPQHVLYLNVKVMKDAGLTGADGRPRVPGSRDELVTMAKRITKADTFGVAIGRPRPGRQ